jgi:ferredoxin-NADP reductase
MSDGASVVDEAAMLIGGTDWVLMATVGAVLFGLVAASSIRLARRRLAYETWYGLHLYAYLAIALGFMHQLTLGTDFIGDPVAVGYWLGLYAVAVGLVLAFRLGAPIRSALRHRLRVAAVVDEGPGVVSLHIVGRRLDRLTVQAGQFFQWRFLAGGGWWRPHPYSLSAAPDGRSLRITVKDLGDDSARVRWLKPGTRVIAEGPYGAFTAERITQPQVVLIAGGIGITPLRAILEDLPPGRGGITLLYRASSWRDVVFRAELDELAASRGAEVVYLVGRRGSRDLPDDPLAPRALARQVPGAPQRDFLVCGPDGFLAHVQRSLRRLHVPKERIHAERFAF